MPRKTPDLDLDFNIFVDPSCLSAPMEDETLATMPPSSEEVQSSTAVSETPDEPVAEVVVEDADQIVEDSTTATTEEAQEPEAEVTPADEDSTEEQPESGITEEEGATEEQEDTSAAEPPTDEPSDPEDEEAAKATPAEEDTPTTEDISGLEADAEQVEEAAEPTPEREEFDEPEPEEEAATEAVFDSEPSEEPAPEAELAEEPVSEECVAEPVSEVVDTESVEETIADELPREEEQVSLGDEERELRGAEDNTATSESAETTAVDELEEANNTSAQEINDTSEGPHQEGILGEDNSLVSTDSHDTYVLGEDAQSTANTDSSSRRQSSEPGARHIPSRSISSDDAGDSSSHNERDDDVFSDRSARSSIYSIDQHDVDIPSIKTPQGKESFSRRDSYPSSQGHDHSSARTASNFSAISGLSQYDDPKLTFMPTHRENRMPFRTPSEIRAMQMTSPTPSVFNGSSPSRSSAHKSHNHHHHHHHQNPRSSNGPPSSISRLGSPTVSAQYSPKGRSTPPRFKTARKEAPLVLLHVTLLPLRWVWGDVLNTLDSVLQPPAKSATAVAVGDAPASSSSSSSSPAAPFEASDPLKTLRDAWRELQDRVGDTVLERGILLPHPQNDYEVLEERLLEALELPLKRRARILECGHYVGPANVPEDGESDDEGAESGEGKMHWCGTCCGEIRCEDLGIGRVFRVKVYASNGLMRAGAWEACWKEMERVDIEVEPIVELAVQNELEKLAVLQMELEEQRRRELDLERMPEPEPERKSNPDSRAASRQQADLTAEAEMDAQRGMMSSPAPSALQLAMRAATPQPSASNTLVRAATPSTYGVDSSEERRLRDEERMREIYGDMPSTTSAAPPQQPTDQHQQPQQPQQPPAQQEHAHYPPPQQQQQQHALPPPLPMLTDGSSHHQDPYRRPPVVLDENAGFVDLLTQAFKVLLRDPKNVAIILLCVFLVVMVKRPGMGAGTGTGVAVNEVQVVPPQVVQVPVPAAGQGYRYEGLEGFEGGKVEGVAAVAAVGAGVEVKGGSEVDVGLATSRLPEVAGLEGVVAATEPEEKEVVEAVEAVEEVQQQEAVVEEVPVVIEEELEQEVVLESQEDEVVDAQEVAEPEVQKQAPRFELPADMCAPRGPEYPITLVGETPAAEEVSEDLEDAANVDDSSATGQEEPAAECEADNDQELEDALPAPTSTFLPGPFVTERTTVRVFETVTQTVRVSVVTQTETVSTVVTAIPQTVEETVFETETVRITVSVPVEEQQKKGKAKPTKGCQEKGGWF